MAQAETLGCRLSKDEAQLVRKLAADRDVFVNQVIREALAREVGFPLKPAAAK